MKTPDAATASVTSGCQTDSPIHMETRLGYTQKRVLQLLAAGSKSAQHLEYDGFGISASAARSALLRLGQRGLVDVAGWDDYGRRTYCLTVKGAEVERDISGIEDDDGDE